MPRKPVPPKSPRPGADTGRADTGQPAGKDLTRELEQRIARLEKRLDQSFLGDDGLAAVENGNAIDHTLSGDPLQKAVRRSNDRRGSRKD